MTRTQLPDTACACEVCDEYPQPCEACGIDVCGCRRTADCDSGRIFCTDCVKTCLCRECAVLS